MILSTRGEQYLAEKAQVRYQAVRTNRQRLKFKIGIYPK